MSKRRFTMSDFFPGVPSADLPPELPTPAAPAEPEQADPQPQAPDPLLTLITAIIFTGPGFSGDATYAVEKAKKLIAAVASDKEKESA